MFNIVVSYHMLKVIRHFPFFGYPQTLGGLEPPTSLSTGLDEDILTVAAGKDFTLVRTVGGKVSP